MVFCNPIFISNELEFNQTYIRDVSNYHTGHRTVRMMVTVKKRISFTANQDGKLYI